MQQIGLYLTNTPSDSRTHTQHVPGRDELQIKALCTSCDKKQTQLCKIKRQLTIESEMPACRLQRPKYIGNRKLKMAELC